MKKLTYALVICFALASAIMIVNSQTPEKPKTVKSESEKPEKDMKKMDHAKVMYTCPMHKEVNLDKPGKCPKCGMAMVKKTEAKVMYTCPMHKEIVQYKPGKCPKCGMDLKKKESANMKDEKKMVEKKM
jgi:ssDNA-binding Zn-finger/Zn-ribbon topoisomerase 1